MADTTIQLHKQGFFVKGFIADGEYWKSEHVALIASQLTKMITYYLNHPSIVPMSLLGMPLHYLTSELPVRRCGTEKFEEVSVAADGQQWACHRCSPFENHGTWKIPDKYLDLINARHLQEE
jgi:hypothetical protein